ncbi:aminoglycoside phosphotransferase [Actinoalloteichus caeruleus]|uniref:aminoglycoside phosphotransferase n=1 Tax=Actinoalloteichus TaxID=65496 RepID=UPI003AACF6D4
MHGNLDRAAERFGVVVIGEPLLGWLDRSISAPVRKGGADYWLRVVSEDKQWIGGDFWTGNVDANVVTGLAKPRVLDVFEWEEWRQQRAEIMTRLPGSPCSPTDALRAEVDLADEWWTELRHTVDVIATTPTERVNSTQDKVADRIVHRFGDAVDPAVPAWETVHGDVHWANLFGPRFGLLDWELWGRGPVGTDAATLLCYSLLVPTIAQRVHKVFADVLDTEAGRFAQLYVIARLSRRTDSGEFPDLAGPLERRARALLNP